MTFAQKLVQARVYAQGLTLASLVGMAALTSIPSAGDKIIEEHSHASEHSWRDVLGEEGREKRADPGQRLNTKPKAAKDSEKAEAPKGDAEQKQQTKEREQSQSQQGKEPRKDGQ